MLYLLTSVFYKTLLLLVTGPNNAIDLQMYSDDVSCFGFDGAASVGLINGNSFSLQDNFDNGNYNTNYGVLLQVYHLGLWFIKW